MASSSIIATAGATLIPAFRVCGNQWCIISERGRKFKCDPLQFLLSIQWVQRPPCLMNLPMLLLCQQGTIKVMAAGRTLREKKPHLSQTRHGQGWHLPSRWITTQVFQLKMKNGEKTRVAVCSVVLTSRWFFDDVAGNSWQARATPNKFPTKPSKSETTWIYFQYRNSKWNVKANPNIPCIWMPLWNCGPYTMLWVGCKLASLQNRKL